MRSRQLSYLILVTAVTAYASVAEARTVIQNKGSDTLVNVAQAWAEEYRKVDPDVAVAVSGGGSGTGIAAMINGTVDIANASRKMKDKEIKLANAAELRDAFSNLVFNAVRHTPPHTVIQVKWTAHGNGAQLTVADNGGGIPRRHIPRLTERFYR